MFSRAVNLPWSLAIFASHMKELVRPRSPARAPSVLTTSPFTSRQLAKQLNWNDVKLIASHLIWSDLRFFVLGLATFSWNKISLRVKLYRIVLEISVFTSKNHSKKTGIPQEYTMNILILSVFYNFFWFIGNKKIIKKFITHKRLSFFTLYLYIFLVILNRKYRIYLKSSLYQTHENIRRGFPTISSTARRLDNYGAHRFFLLLYLYFYMQK